jgi:hypothetical protein
MKWGQVSDHALRMGWPRNLAGATAMTPTVMYPDNDTLGERLRLYVEENFHNA